MNLKILMSGIAVAIDDEFEETDKKKEDKIFRIVENIEDEWEMPFYKTHKIPPDGYSDSLLRSASFVLLDWKLWRSGSAELEKDGIEKNIRFLEKAKEYFIPVFIFTNENPSDVTDKLPEDLYDAEKSESNFIFIKSKSKLAEKNDIFDSIGEWIERNASVYALKAWEREFYESKRALFSSMYTKSPDWPKVFWKSYEDDGVDPSSSLANLINDHLSGRFRTDIFEKHILDSGFSGVSLEDLRSLIQNTSFVGNDNLPDNEIRSGDLFIPSEGKYLINIRPDCDCIPRLNVKTADDVELYCLQGKRLSEEKLRESYQNGAYSRINEQRFRFKVNTWISFSSSSKQTLTRQEFSCQTASKKSVFF
ncbi:MAG: hypothetical protein OXC39_08860, partial [Candidatus Dadabacteria bacterium]|nr:hypothetical protein [Candidatus Dadabacteria bacterium]